jgi:predicted nucleic acid-binding protein
VPSRASSAKLPVELPVGLIDTGAILALVDRNDESHGPCVEAYNASRLPWLTTEAVLAETFYLVRRNLRDDRGVWTLLRSGAIRMSVIDNEELPQIHALMTQYADCPMDFADATLVHLAARERLSVIFTIDHDDFETYRLPGRKKFTILPRPCKP